MSHLTSETQSLVPRCLNERLRTEDSKCGDLRQQKLQGPAAATPCFMGKCCNLSQFMSQIIDITLLKDAGEVCIGMI